VGRLLSNLNFKLMILAFKVRDLLLPRTEVLKEVTIEPGAVVLDYGCGPGSYTIEVAKRVGANGRVYALDIHPLAAEAVQKRAAKENLTNIETLRSDCATGLEDASVDVALLYDTFHLLSEPRAVLAELHRVLRPDGILSFNDHHMNEEKIVGAVAASGLFKLSNRGKRTYTFVKELA
jgi:ubiquinone/menaquinone biosynthesis C-methylase UbiE